jgi:hypothetical protein
VEPNDPCTIRFTLDKEAKRITVDQRVPMICKRVSMKLCSPDTVPTLLENACVFQTANPPEKYIFCRALPTPERLSNRSPSSRRATGSPRHHDRENQSRKFQAFHGIRPSSSKTRSNPGLRWPLQGRWPAPCASAGALPLSDRCKPS